MIAVLAVLLLGGCGSGTAIPEGLSESDIMQGKGSQTSSGDDAATGAGADGQGDSGANTQTNSAGQGDSGVDGQGNAGGQGDSAANSEGNAAGQGEAAGGRQSAFAGAKPADIGDALIGAEQMSGHIRELKTAIESDDVTRSRELAGLMASIWLAMESEVRDSQPELHKSLHGDLTALLTGLQEEEWNKAGLVELDYVLYQSFRDLRGKLDQ